MTPTKRGRSNSMFDLGLDKEKEELVARVATLARERFAPRAAAYDRDAAFPAEDFVDLFKAGLFGASIPREYGGLGLGPYFDEVGYPFDSGDHNILWLAIGGPRKGLPIAPRFQACDGHGACVILDRPETQPRGPIACRPASGAPGCILGAVCWRPWIDQTTTPRGYLSQVDTPFSTIPSRCG